MSARNYVILVTMTAIVAAAIGFAWATGDRISVIHVGPSAMQAHFREEHPGFLLVPIIAAAWGALRFKWWGIWVLAISGIVLMFYGVVGVLLELANPPPSQFAIALIFLVAAAFGYSLRDCFD
jgi:hypothetical protein